MHPSSVHLLFQIPVYQQGQEAGQEVRLDAVVPLEIYRSRLHFGFRHAEVVLHYPPAAVQAYHLLSRCIKVRADTVEAVEACLLLYHLLIQGKAFHLRQLTVFRAILRLDEPFCIVRALALRHGRPSRVQQCLRPGNLPLAHVGQVVSVFEREGEIDPNEETGNLEGDNSDNNDNSSSSFEELMAIPFDNIDLMDKAWFVGYDKSHDCLKGCYAILDNMGIDEHGSSAEVIYLARENESHTALENYGNNVEENYKNAVNCINDHLEEGRAIIVGADYKLGNDANDGTIDHFVLIVGCGFDEILNENYYIYVEIGTYHDYKGVNPEDNRFYYDQEKEMFVDEQNYSNKELTITEIRPNNGEEYDTISQPSKY